MSAANAQRPITIARSLPRPFRRQRVQRQRVLGGGSIGHILRNRKINPETYAATDVWYHYDQVGSVMFRSNASGSALGYRLSDAFGNQLASPTTGTALWASDATSAGWGHNTKEHGASTGLVYMYQRWYMPETGTFLSTAPYPPHMEEPYVFVSGAPVALIDADGRIKGGVGCCSLDMPSSEEIKERLYSIVSNSKIAKCIASRIRRSTVTCYDNASPRCKDGRLASGAGGGLFGQGGDGVTFFKGSTVSLCTDNIRAQGCGKNDVMDILIHEYAHNCGLPPEPWRGGNVAPGDWGSSGVPRTMTGGRLQCTGN